MKRKYFIYILLVVVSLFMFDNGVEAKVLSDKKVGYDSNCKSLNLKKNWLFETDGYDINCIYGKYDEHERQLAYMQLSDEEAIASLLYVFHDIRKDGEWSSYDTWAKKFENFEGGAAQVKLEEVTGDDLEKLSKCALNTFNKCLNSLSNLMLIRNGVEDYMNLFV